MFTLYLNNSGSRWISFNDPQYSERVKHTFKTVSGKDIIRIPIYYYSFGNFGGMIISYKGKKIRVLADTVLED